MKHIAVKIFDAHYHQSTVNNKGVVGKHFLENYSKFTYLLKVDLLSNKES